MSPKEIKFAQELDLCKLQIYTIRDSYNLLYFLYRGNTLVYIGQTTNHIAFSIDRHKKDGKVFNRYSYVRVDEKLNLKAIEELCIDQHTPELNKDGKFQKKRRALAKTLGITYEQAVKLKIEIKI
jgi:hypothetical protein